MSTRNRQSERILELLQQREWVDLPTILRLGIASHTRRISDLRRRGLTVECRKQWVDGQLRTAYKLHREEVAA